jgi:hypothetical protein
MAASETEKLLLQLVVLVSSTRNPNCRQLAGIQSSCALRRCWQNTNSERTNLPVTQREYQFPGEETLLSTTDTASQISYANAAFIRTRGFTPDELMGQSDSLRCSN